MGAESTKGLQADTPENLAQKVEGSRDFYLRHAGEIEPSFDIPEVKENPYGTLSQFSDEDKAKLMANLTAEVKEALGLVICLPSK